MGVLQLQANRSWKGGKSAGLVGLADLGAKKTKLIRLSWEAGHKMQLKLELKLDGGLNGSRAREPFPTNKGLSESERDLKEGRRILELNSGDSKILQVGISPPFDVNP
jgi:hypothetical protein